MFQCMRIKLMYVYNNVWLHHHRLSRTFAQLKHSKVPWATRSQHVGSRSLHAAAPHCWRSKGNWQKVAKPSLWSHILWNDISINVSSSIHFFIPHPPPSLTQIICSNITFHIYYIISHISEICPKKDIENFNPPKMLPPYCRYLPTSFPIFPSAPRDVIQGLRVAVLRLQLCQAEPQALWTHWVANVDLTFETFKNRPKHGLNQDVNEKDL